MRVRRSFRAVSAFGVAVSVCLQPAAASIRLMHFLLFSAMENKRRNKSHPEFNISIVFNSTLVRGGRTHNARCSQAVQFENLILPTLSPLFVWTMCFFLPVRPAGTTLLPSPSRFRSSQTDICGTCDLILAK